MSKKVYINKTFLSAYRNSIGYSPVMIDSYRDATIANGLTLSTLPNLVKLAETEIISDTIVSELKKSPLSPTEDAHIIEVSTSYRKYIGDFRIRFNVPFTKAELEATTFYKNYRNKVILTFYLVADYDKENSIHNVTFPVAFPASAVVPGDNEILIQAPIANIARDIDGIAYPLSRLEYPLNDTIAITEVEGYTITNADAVECFRTTGRFVVLGLVGSIHKPSSNTSLFSATLPEGNLPGKIFIKRFSARELPQQHCFYPYGGKNDRKPITVFTEAASQSYYREVETTYDIYECTNNSFRNPSKYLDMLSIDNSEVNSSFEGSTMVIPEFNSDNNELEFFSTTMQWFNLEKVAWFDCAMFRFVFPNRTTPWYPLSHLLLKGIPTQTGDTTVSVEVALPDLCTLVDNSMTLDTLNLDSYTGSFYPYVPLQIYLELGYQSCYPTKIFATESGLYLDTTKLRRFFIDTKEVEYFVTDELVDTQILTTKTQITGTLKLTVGTVYQARGTLRLSNTRVTEVIVNSYPTNILTKEPTFDISYTGLDSIISYTFWGNKAASAVVTIEYTYVKL